MGIEVDAANVSGLSSYRPDQELEEGRTPDSGIATEESARGGVQEVPPDACGAFPDELPGGGGQESGYSPDESASRSQMQRMFGRSSMTSRFAASRLGELEAGAGEAEAPAAGAAPAGSGDANAPGPDARASNPADGAAPAPTSAARGPAASGTASAQRDGSDSAAAVKAPDPSSPGGAAPAAAVRPATPAASAATTPAAASPGGTDYSKLSDNLTIAGGVQGTPGFAIDQARKLPTGSNVRALAERGEKMAENAIKSSPAAKTLAGIYRAAGPALTVAGGAATFADRYQKSDASSGGMKALEAGLATAGNVAFGIAAPPIAAVDAATGGNVSGIYNSMAAYVRAGIDSIRTGSTAPLDRVVAAAKDPKNPAFGKIIGGYTVLGEKVGDAAYYASNVAGRGLASAADAAKGAWRTVAGWFGR
ncbi:MAG: hypothetical protein HYV63_16945 [Candidatus Schekmanbacteria bacterium]|nr:hypothetical protein [Candidatus Schekmanbacteria bacterium]